MQIINELDVAIKGSKSNATAEKTLQVNIRSVLYYEIFHNLAQIFLIIKKIFGKEKDTSYNILYLCNIQLFRR